MAYITFGSISKFLFYPIIGGIFKFIAELVLFHIKPKVTNYPYMLGINASLGMCLSLLPFIFEKIRAKTRNRRDSKYLKLLHERESAISKLDPYKKENSRKIYYKICLLIIACILDFTQKVLTFLFVEDIENNFWIFDIMFLTIFSIIILKTKLYKHQYISLAIIVILGITQNIVNLYDKKVKFLSLLLIFSIEITYTFNMVINKISMENYFCSPFEISFYEGFFALAANVILLKINKKYNFYNYYNIIDKREILLFVLLMLSRWSFNIFGLLTVKFFTPSHVVLLLIIGEITFSFKYKDIWKLSLTIPIFLLLLFALLVFMEILELNFCGLEYFTKNHIGERALLESLKDSENEINAEKGNESTLKNSEDDIEIEGYNFELHNESKSNSNDIKK